jgi:hypothetical protein
MPLASLGKLGVLGEELQIRASVAKLERGGFILYCKFDNNNVIVRYELRTD